MSFLWFDVLNQAGAEAARLRARGLDRGAVLAGTRDWLAGRGIAAEVATHDGHDLLELGDGVLFDAWPADGGPPATRDPPSDHD
jgi:hypothetical protein